MEFETSEKHPGSGTGPASWGLRGWKRIGASVAAAVVLIALPYGIGRVQGAHETSRVRGVARAAEARTDASARDLRSRVTALEGDVARATHAAAVLEGRRQLGLALLSLDDRNFGTAQGQVDGARAALGHLGADDAGLAEVARSLGSLSIVAAGDFADQRARVLAIVRAFDQHLSNGAPRR